MLEEHRLKLSMQLARIWLHWKAKLKMRRVRVVQDVIPLVKVFAMRAVIVDAKDARGVQETVAPLARAVVRGALMALTKHKAPRLPLIQRAILQERILAQVPQDV